jgi:hypothetical protein
MPRGGGWLHEVGRWACCGLRRSGGPSPGFEALLFISLLRSRRVRTVPLLGLGARHRGIVELSEGS